MANLTYTTLDEAEGARAARPAFSPRPHPSGVHEAVTALPALRWLSADAPLSAVPLVALPVVGSGIGDMAAARAGVKKAWVAKVRTDRQAGRARARALVAAAQHPAAAAASLASLQVQQKKGMWDDVRMRARDGVVVRHPHADLCCSTGSLFAKAGVSL